MATKEMDAPDSIDLPSMATKEMDAPDSIDWKILVCGDRKSGVTSTCESIDRAGREFAKPCKVFGGHGNFEAISYHCILVAISVHNVGKWKTSCISELVKQFGESVYSHFVVAFTFTDTLPPPEKDVQPGEDPAIILRSMVQLHVVAHASADLKAFLKNKCGERYVCLNNTAKEPERERQMKQLSGVIEDVVYLNGGAIKHRIVVLGSRSAGKSTLCNLILREEVFPSTRTTETSCYERNLEGMQVLVADTPAIPVIQPSSPEIEREISKSIFMTSPGPRVVILVIRIDQGVEEVKQCVEYIKKYFGESELSRILLAISNKWSLTDKEFATFLANYDRQVQSFIQNLKRQENIIYFNDPSSDMKKEKIFSQILKIAASLMTYEESRSTFVLLGSQGVGKSYAANHILQSDAVFHTGHDDCPCIAVATRRTDTRRVTVVDTPGDMERNIAEMKKYKMFQKSEPFILVLVMKYFDHKDVRKVPEKTRKSLQLIANSLPDLISQKLVMAFTNMDNAEDVGPSTFENFLRELSGQFKELFRSCSYRCVAVDNLTRNRTIKQQQIDPLFVYSDKLLKGNKMVRLVLFGVTGQGKSATANTIGGPGVKVFKKSNSGISHTDTCKSHTFEDRYQVIDTPGLFDNRHDKTTKTMLEISKSIYLSAPGPDAFLMVSSIGTGRFTKQHKDCFRYFKEMFGNSVCSHTIFILSKKDNLNTSLEEYVTESRKQPQFDECLTSCNNRYVAFNNEQRTGLERDELMDIVGPMIAGNRGQHFTNKAYKDIERRIWLFGSGKALTARTWVENNKLASSALYTVFSVLIGLGIFSTGVVTAPLALTYAAWQLGLTWWGITKF